MSYKSSRGLGRFLKSVGEAVATQAVFQQPVSLCLLALLLFGAAAHGAPSAEHPAQGEVDGLVIEDGDYWLLGWACLQGSDEPAVVTVTAGPQGAVMLGRVSTGERSAPAVAARCDNQSMMQRFRFRLPDWAVAGFAGEEIRADVDGTTLSGSGSHRLPALPARDPLQEMLTYLEVHGSLNILFVQAHADDEQHAMPVIAQLCPRSTVTCDFAVATGAGSMTEIELRELAAHIGGNVVTMLDLPPSNEGDSPQQVLRDWSRHAAGGDLVDMMTQLLTDTQPDVVVALDPRHGVTCHPQHIALGELLLASVERGAYPAERVVFASHVLRIEDGERWLGVPFEVFVQPQVSIGPMTGGTLPGYWAYSGDARAYQSAPSGPRVWDWQLDLTAHYQSQWADTPYLEWLRPLHRADGRWVGNDVSGRITVLHRLQDFDPLSPLFVDYCQSEAAASSMPSTKHSPLSTIHRF